MRAMTIVFMEPMIQLVTGMGYSCGELRVSIFPITIMWSLLQFLRSFRISRPQMIVIGCKKGFPNKIEVGQFHHYFGFGIGFDLSASFWVSGVFFGGDHEDKPMGTTNLPTIWVCLKSGEWNGMDQPWISTVV